eukprot:3497297-Prymnesium_polylepis.1
MNVHGSDASVTRRTWRVRRPRVVRTQCAVRSPPNPTNTSMRPHAPTGRDSGHTVGRGWARHRQRGARAQSGAATSSLALDALGGESRRRRNAEPFEHAAHIGLDGAERPLERARRRLAEQVHLHERVEVKLDERRDGLVDERLRHPKLEVHQQRDDDAQLQARAHLLELPRPGSGHRSPGHRSACRIRQLP